MKLMMAAMSFLLMIAHSGLCIGSTWTIDPQHSHVGFKIRHMMIADVKGSFEKFSGSVEIDDADVTKSRLEVSVDMDSIDTNVDKRDDHLRSPDFFDVAKYPKMSFVSKKVERIVDGKLRVSGDLTLHGVTREIILDVQGPTGEIKDPWGHVRRGASAVSKLNRKDFGINWNKDLDAGGVAVGDEVIISLEIEMIKK